MVQTSVVAWSDHKAFVLHGMRMLFESGEHTDLEIRCHDRVFRVHKLILGLFTDYFQSCDAIWMRIDVSPENMESMLKFIYLGQARMKQGNFLPREVGR